MATGDERLEKIIGTINGVNRSFQTVLPYQVGTLRVWINGILHCQPDEDGWNEIDPDIGTFEMKEAPLVFDTLHVRYIEQ